MLPGPAAQSSLHLNVSWFHFYRNPKLFNLCEEMHQNVIYLLN